MKKLDSFYLLILYAPVLYIFYTMVTWFTCKPISEVGNYKHVLGGAEIPSDATCFSKNHMTHLSFHSFPPIDESQYILVLLALIFVILVGLLIAPTLRLSKVNWVRTLFSHNG